MSSRSRAASRSKPRSPRAAISHALPTPSPDDLYLVCTGGTTGHPKGVQWRQGDVYVAAMGGADDATADSIAATAAQPAQVWFAAPPLMHGAAQWTVYAALHNGRTVVLHDDAAPFDARTILETAARERATLLTIVGDAYARPMIDELRARHYDLASLRQLATGGALTGPAQQARAARPVAARDDHRRLRRVGDGRDGVRRVDEGRADAGVPPVGGRRRALGRPHPLPRSRATTRSAGSRGSVGSRSAT